MANQYFQFKQFKIDQEQAAMKVCTDSCIFGAWIEPGEASAVLDIGTGTGVLSLMLAQRSDANFDAVEIDEAAAAQAKQNVAQSPWADRISVHHTSIQEYAENTQKTYDLIVTNPPFYSNYLKSEKENVNVAYHSVALPTDELLEAVKKMLRPSGRLIVLLPPYEAELMREEALSYGLYTSKILQIKDKETAPIFRSVTEFSFSLAIPIVKELVIKKEDGSYSNEFAALLKEYYLAL
ncbi:MAG TPA: methyltransferase [Cytophagaceae bacterium]|jgi:tRNA1Val (adenine37-N6)-methyltransferase|nr:methyltransferase [Cytophagaceae bacterium]